MPRLLPLPQAAPVVKLPARPNGARGDPQKFAVRVRASRIDGQGAFAAEAIPAGRKIGEIRGEPIGVQEARRRAKGAARIMIVALSERRAIAQQAQRQSSRTSFRQTKWRRSSTR